MVRDLKHKDYFNKLKFIKENLQSNNFIDFYKKTTSFNRKNNRQDRFIVGILKTPDKKLLEADFDNFYL